MKIGLIVYCFTLGVLSLIAFMLYGIDKVKAKRRAWRIPEKVLLGISLFGGAVGGLLGMIAFRHKTRHWYFWFLNLVGLIWQVAVLFILWI